MVGKERTNINRFVTYHPLPGRMPSQEGVDRLKPCNTMRRHLRGQWMRAAARLCGAGFAVVASIDKCRHVWEWFWGQGRDFRLEGESTDFSVQC